MIVYFHFVSTIYSRGIVVLAPLCYKAEVAFGDVRHLQWRWCTSPCRMPLGCYGSMTGQLTQVLRGTHRWVWLWHGNSHQYFWMPILRCFSSWYSINFILITDPFFCHNQQSITEQYHTSFGNNEPTRSLSLWRWESPQASLVRRGLLVLPALSC